MQQTNVKGLYAAGDVQNPYSGALEAAYTGGMAAFSMVSEWYDQLWIDGDVTVRKNIWNAG